MIHQLNMHGKDKVQVAIERLQMFEPKDEGYYLAFSGGKDSVVIKALADMAGVKYDAHYNLTSVDPPELVKFIKTFDDVQVGIPRDKEGKRITMWNLIVKIGIPPTRIMRYCCQYLKETQGEGRFVVTGVRWAESNKRKVNRAGLELGKHKTSRRELFDPDNPNQQLIHNCIAHARRNLNPIIDWSNEDVWEFIHEYNIPYCKLYDKGYKRLGCIGCPMSTHQSEELDNNPKYKQAYIRAFHRMLDARKHDKDYYTKEWETGEDVYNWWINLGAVGGHKRKVDEQNERMEWHR